MRLPHRLARAASVLALLLVPGSLRAQHAGHMQQPAAGTGAREELGTIRFPTSAKPAAHAEFERGVLYLHNFHYPQALQSFRQARSLDREDVLSAAFEAFAHTHPVWNEQDTAAARAALRALAPTRAARAAKARTTRERAWLAAIEELYDGSAPKAVRDTAFSRALARLHEQEPADPEAASFYALSLLGLNQGEREPVAYARAEQVSAAVLRRHPQHPGALHYLIHAVDDPANAARGIDAAATYGEVAKSAAHAQHMTSHIFLALGRWADVERANLRAHFAQPQQLHSFGHGTHWLAYALVQQGRVREARAWLDSMLIYQQQVRAGSVPAIRGRGDADLHAVLMTTAHVLDTNAWDSPLATMRFDTSNLPGIWGRNRADFFVGAAAARRAGRAVDLTPGSRAADALLADSMLLRISSRNRAAAGSAAANAIADGRILEQMLRAEIHASRARPDSAVALLRAAAEQLEALPFQFGPPDVGKPPRERAAEILLFNGRPAEALGELDRAERMAPGRTQAALRRARAQLALGRTAEAAKTFSDLAAVWHDADVTLPDREEARWGSTPLAAAAADADVAVDTIEYRSGELRLRGALYRPTAAGRHPALAVLHGSASCWRFSDADILGRLFASHGFVTFFPCRRGLGLSAGQGTAILEQLQREGFTTRDPGYAARSTELLRTTQLPDVRAALAALRSRDDVDSSRLALTGLSYGGILTLLAAEAEPALRAAIAFAPAAMNWGWNAHLREELKASAARTRAPVLILQAENDWHTGPARELPPAFAPGSAEGKVYPAVGASAMDGHAFMVTTPDLWREDVLAFLRRHLGKR